MRKLISAGEAARPVAFAEAPRPVSGPGEALVEVEAFVPDRGETFVPERPRPGLPTGGAR